MPKQSISLLNTQLRDAQQAAPTVPFPTKAASASSEHHTVHPTVTALHPPQSTHTIHPTVTRLTQPVMICSRNNTSSHPKVSRPWGRRLILLLFSLRALQHVRAQESTQHSENRRTIRHGFWFTPLSCYSTFTLY